MQIETQEAIFAEYQKELNEIKHKLSSKRLKNLMAMQNARTFDIVIKKYALVFYTHL